MPWVQMLLYKLESQRNNLCSQAQAVAHKQAHMEAQLHAQHLAAKAQRHEQARMEAAAQVHHLKRVVQMGVHLMLCSAPFVRHACSTVPYLCNLCFTYIGSWS